MIAESHDPNTTLRVSRWSESPRSSLSAPGRTSGPIEPPSTCTAQRTTGGLDTW